MLKDYSRISQNLKKQVFGEEMTGGEGVTKCQTEIQAQNKIYEALAKFIPAQGLGPYFSHPQD